MFLVKGVLKICSKFTGKHPCRNVISIKLQSTFIEITLRHGCSSVNSLHFFRIAFSKNTSGWLLLILAGSYSMIKIKWAKVFNNGPGKICEMHPSNRPCFNRPCHFKLFIGCIPQISLGPFFVPNVQGNVNLTVIIST